MAGSVSSGGRRGRWQPKAEINVTPFVDVMLVLLIVFMITAPLLTVGVPVELPETEARSMAADDEPLTVMARYSFRKPPSNWTSWCRACRRLAGRASKAASSSVPMKPPTMAPSCA